MNWTSLKNAGLKFGSGHCDEPEVWDDVADNDGGEVIPDDNTPSEEKLGVASRVKELEALGETKPSVGS